MTERSGADNYFELVIWLPGQGPMRDLVRAKTIQEAIHWAKFRYKNAKVEIAQPSAKPELARSHTSPGTGAVAYQSWVVEKTPP